MKSAIASVLLTFGACLSPLVAQTLQRSDGRAEATRSAPSPVNGTIDGDFYVAPNGCYRMKIPVLPQLGGAISDTPNVVNFDDDFNTHISVAQFPLTPGLKSEYDRRGAKGFLVNFFTSSVMPDFADRFPGSKMEPDATFLPKLQDGAMLIFTLLPGGSYFEHRVALSRWLSPAVAKRGNLCFVVSGHIFVVSAELAERVLERSTYAKTAEEENAILRERLLELVAKMQFNAAPGDVKN